MLYFISASQMMKSGQCVCSELEVLVSHSSAMSNLLQKISIIRVCNCK